jgi:hypothetical protein
VPIQRLCLATRFKTEALIEISAEPLVSLDDGFATTECRLGFHRKLDKMLVRSVERLCLVRYFKGARRITRLQTESANTIEEIQAERTQSALFAVYPERIDSGERLAAEKCERSFE